jgi:hypothetical protein
MSMIIDGTNGLTFNNATTQASAGVVLQVVSGTLSTAVSTSSSTMADLGLSVSITPKFSTSKVLVFVSINSVGKYTNNTWGQFNLLRGSTLVTNIAGNVGYNGTTTINGGFSVCTCYLDSPATTASTTYKIQFASGNNNSAIWVNDIGNSNSVITAMEIAG